MQRAPIAVALLLIASGLAVALAGGISSRGDLQEDAQAADTDGSDLPTVARSLIQDAEAYRLDRPDDLERYGPWFDLGRRRLQRSQAALDQDLPTQAIGSSRLARWYYEVPTRFGRADTAEMTDYVADHDPDQRMDRLEGEIDALRGRVDVQGLEALVLAQRFYAKALIDVEVHRHLEDQAATGGSADDVRRLAYQTALVDVDLDIVEELVELARDHPGDLPRDAGVSDLVEDSRQAVDDVAKVPRLEDQPRSAYHKAKHRYPSHVDRMLERGWTEGAAAFALDTLLHARLQQRMEAGDNATEAEAAERLRDLDDPAGVGTFVAERARWQFGQGDRDPAAYTLVVETAKLDPERTEVHRRLTGVGR